MLWICGQITSGKLIIKLILPSLICLLVPLIVTSFTLKGKVQRVPDETSRQNGFSTAFERNLVFFGGVILLISVPIFKTITHLPPYMGILLALGILWVITELMHHEKEEGKRQHLSV